MAILRAAIAAILVAASGPTFAARWSAIDTGLPTTAPGIASLAIAPTGPPSLYALTTRGAILKSTDGGESWRPLNGVVGVDFLAIDPKDSSTMYAATHHAIVKSTDGGQSWNSASNGLTDSSAYWLAINPIDPSTLYAATSSGISKSVNGGGSWKAIGASPSSANEFLGSPVIDPLTQSTIYALSSNRGVVKSTDAGESWIGIKPGYDLDYSITSMAIDPLNPSTLYAGFFSRIFTMGDSPTGGVFKSTDGGKTWTAFQSGMPATFFITSLAIDPVTPSTIYAIVTSNSGGGMVKSVDGGQSWNFVSDGLPGNFRGALAIDPSTPSTVYAGYANYTAPADIGAIFKSTQGGGNWKRADAGLAGVDADLLAIDPVNTGTVYAGVSDAVFKKADGGAGWTKLVAFEIHNSFSLTPGGPPLAGPGPAKPRSLVIDFLNPNVLYAWTARHSSCVVFDRLLFTTTDGGANWNDSVSPPQNPCVFSGFLVMDPTDPKTLYLVESDELDGGYWVRKTVDGGANWRDIWDSQVYGPNTLVIDPANGATLYAGTGSGVFKSTDGGSSWNNVGLKKTNVTALTIDPVDPAILYAATAGVYPEPVGFRGLFKSVDSGTTWLPADSGLAGLTGVGAVITSLVSVPSNRSLLYAGTSADGVYKSLDGGASWLKFNDGLSNLEIRALVSAPGNTSSLYAATAGGIFKIVDELSQ